MPKSLVSNKTTVSHKGSKRTHIRFSERESALDETKSAVRLVVEADALCTHSHGLKWSSSSSVGAPSLSNPAVTPFTTTQAAQSGQGTTRSYQEDDDEVLEPRRKARKRRKRNKKRRHEKRLAIRDHPEEEEDYDVLQVLIENRMVKDKGVIDQKEVGATAEVLMSEQQNVVVRPADAVAAATTTRATRQDVGRQEGEEDGQQTRGSSGGLPSDEARLVAVSVASRLSSVVVLRETRFIFVQGSTLGQTGLVQQQMNTEEESWLQNFSLPGPELQVDPNLSQDWQHFLPVEYEYLTLLDESYCEVDERSLDVQPLLPDDVKSAVDLCMDNDEEKIPSTSDSTFQEPANQEHRQLVSHWPPDQEQTLEVPFQAENTDSLQCSCWKKSLGIPDVCCMIGHSDGATEENSCSDAVQNCEETRNARALLGDQKAIAELDGGASQEKEHHEGLTAQELQEQRRRDYVASELIQGRPEQEEKVHPKRSRKNRRARGGNDHRDRQSTKENLEESLREELLRHEASLAELVRRF